jgi:hypothetical protein
MATQWVPPPVIPPGVSPDKNYPVVIQSADWTCSCASLAWVMSALGVPSPSRGNGYAWDEWDGVREVRRCAGTDSAVDPSYGLAYGSGIALESTYRAYGFSVIRQVGIDWTSAAMYSARYVGQFGGGRWYHWSAVRWFDGELDEFILANPAPSWKGVGQQLDQTEWGQWGPWTGVWVSGLE